MIQATNKQDLTFKRLLAPKDVQQMPAFKELKPWLLLRSELSDVFVAKNPENPRQFSVTIQTLSGHFPKTEKSITDSTQHLKEAFLTADAKHNQALASVKLPPEIETPLRELFRGMDNLFGGFGKK